MPRPPRNAQPGLIYHVCSRGSNREPIYRDAFDHIVFGRLLARFAQRQRWLVLAWVEMTNHYHLLVDIPFGGLSLGMQLLNTGYACRFNRRHAHTAHVFRNRFWSTSMRDDAHLLRTCRYIVLNPVRAGLCERPEDWPWSSYRASAGLELTPPFLADTSVLRLFGRDPEAARRAYREFVSQGIPPVSDTGFQRAREPAR